MILLITKEGIYVYNYLTINEIFINLIFPLIIVIVPILLQELNEIIMGHNKKTQK